MTHLLPTIYSLDPQTASSLQ